MAKATPEHAVVEESPVTGAPPVETVVEPQAQPALGQVVVESPTGSRSVVFDYQVESLQAQGYRTV